MCLISSCRHPIKTDITLGFASLDFPTITLCNVNPIRRSMVYLDPSLERFIMHLEEFESKAKEELEKDKWWLKEMAEANAEVNKTQDMGSNSNQTDSTTPDELSTDKNETDLGTPAEENNQTSPVNRRKKVSLNTSSLYVFPFVFHYLFTCHCSHVILC